jgi:phage gp36-like protein
VNRSNHPGNHSPERLAQEEGLSEEENVSEQLEAATQLVECYLQARRVRPITASLNITLSCTFH